VSESILATKRKGVIPLVLAGLASIGAVVASACCVWPLIAALGVGGAWIANLAPLAPYRPFFLVVALVALLLAYRRIFRPARQCASWEICDRLNVRAAYRIIFGIVAVMIVIALVFPSILPLLMN
jgi:mercuric ion transport protein